MGTEGTAAGPQGLLWGFMGSRCCRSTVSAYSACPLNQSSASAPRRSGHLPSWQSPRGRKGAEKTNKSSETCRVKRFPLRGGGTPKRSAGSLRGASQMCRGAGCGPGIPPGLTDPGRGRGTGHLPACPAPAAVTVPRCPRVPYACRGPAGRGRGAVRPPSPHLPGSATLGTRGCCSAALHHSPYTMGCSLPILAPASG